MDGATESFLTSITSKVSPLRTYMFSASFKLDEKISDGLALYSPFFLPDLEADLAAPAAPGLFGDIEFLLDDCLTAVYVSCMT